MSMIAGVSPVTVRANVIQSYRAGLSEEVAGQQTPIKKTDLASSDAREAIDAAEKGFNQFRVFSALVQGIENLQRQVNALSAR